MRDASGRCCGGPRFPPYRDCFATPQRRDADPFALNAAAKSTTIYLVVKKVARAEGLPGWVQTIVAQVTHQSGKQDRSVAPPMRR